MKARTKLQQEVVRLSRMLPDITVKQEAWAEQNILRHLGYANKSSCFCLDCGEPFGLDLIHRRRATCPNCGQKLEIKFNRKTTLKQVEYYAITYVFFDFQVVANFELISRHKKGQPADIYHGRIMEYWIDETGKTTKIGKLHNTSFFCDSWIGDWEIRKDTNRGYGYKKYRIYPFKYHPDSCFKPEYKKIGIGRDLAGLDMEEAIRIIGAESKAETLIKAKQWWLLSKCDESMGRIYRYWPSIKICIRNKYTVKGATMWFDYLSLLEGFGKDLHNAKYVCPLDLKKEHDRLVAKRTRIIEAQRAEREAAAEARRVREDAEAAKKFTKRIAPFIGFSVSDKELTVKVLETISDFEMEAKELKHCVFTNEYFKKEDSLILSARIEGKPVETIELSLKSLKVIQARGKHNQGTEYHNKILRLVQKGIPKIKKIIHQTA